MAARSEKNTTNKENANKSIDQLSYGAYNNNIYDLATNHSIVLCDEHWHTLLKCQQPPVAQWLEQSGPFPACVSFPLELYTFLPQQNLPYIVISATKLLLYTM